MMRRRLSAMLILVVLSLQQACAHPPIYRSGMKCYMSYANSDKEVCQASLYAVISNPDRYEGVTVEITGYMRRVYGAIVLYPSRDAYVYSAGQGGVELLVSHPDEIEIMRGKQELEGATTVIGKFTAGIKGGVRGSAGVIKGDIVIFPEHEPGMPPPLPPK